MSSYAQTEQDLTGIIGKKNCRKYFSPRRSCDKAGDLFEERITLESAAIHPNMQLTHLVSLHEYWSEQGFGKENAHPQSFLIAAQLSLPSQNRRAPSTHTFSSPHLSSRGALMRCPATDQNASLEISDYTLTQINFSSYHKAQD